MNTWIVCRGSNNLSIYLNMCFMCAVCAMCASCVCVCMFVCMCALCECVCVCACMCVNDFTAFFRKLTNFELGVISCVC